MGKKGILLSLFILLAPIPTSVVAEDETQLRVNPNVLRPVNGKLPQTLNIAVYAQTCTASTDFLDKSHYSLWATGGLTPTNPKNGKCTITSTLTIDPSLPPGTYDIILLEDDKPVGHAALTVLDASAGAIPPGLAPQVDVLWQVMSQKVCSDVFGGRVSHRFYCIEVKIGNNSGHALQIAGIGFDNADVFGSRVKQGNASYAATRAVLQRESYLSGRNVANHALEGAGLLMASFTPFFARPNPKAHFATASSILSGALVQAYDVIFPDRVPAQLNNLDDESLRDGSVIPNNTQVRTTIFVEERALAEALTAAALRLYDKVKKEAEPSKASPLYEAWHIDVEEEKTLARIMRKTVKSSLQSGRFLGYSTFLVRLALGNLVLVGDPIEYLPRVQIQANPTQQSSAITLGPASLSFGPSQSQQQVTVTNNGSNALTINSVTITGPGSGNFNVTANACGSTVAAGANCLITVTFTPPSTAGTHSATLLIDDSASGSPHSVSLSGTSGPMALLSPTAINFPQQKVGTQSPDQQVTLTNTGSGTLRITDISFAGTNKDDFKLDKAAPGACGQTLAAQEHCTFNIVFTPGQAGSRSGTLQIADDAANLKSPQTVPLSGTGQ